ncbi:MAG: hypothetical protein SVS85_00555 [Candidatus Nanohaloarchaea archaeon]|nr:hypothetical protein [Candidatus Nanohaloarchaea archaeon]
MVPKKRLPIPVQDGEVYLDRRAEDMKRNIEGDDGYTLHDFEKEYGVPETLVVAEEGPTSVVREEEETIQVSDADLAVASRFGHAMEKKLSYDFSKLARTAVAGAATVISGIQFAKNRDPDWLTTGGVSILLGEESAQEVYYNFQERRRFEDHKERMREGLEENYEGIFAFELESQEVDDISAERMPEELQQMIDSLGGSASGEKRNLGFQ